jgi:hypothetical protein
MLVHTTKGAIDHTELRVEDEVSLEGDCRVTKTTWFLGDELVRRDVWASILCPHELAGKQGGV